MLKICNECGKEYETEHKFKRFCPECIKKHIQISKKEVLKVYKTKNSLPKPKTKKHKPVFSIADIITFQENY